MPDRTITRFLGTTVVNLLILALWAGPGPAGAVNFGWQPTEGDPLGGEQCPPGMHCIEWLDGPKVGAVECCSSPPIRGAGCPFGTEIRPPALTFHEDELVLAEKLIPQELPHGSFEVRHTVPEIPLFIDHVTYSPEENGLFDGAPLQFLMCRSSIAESVLYAFTSRKELFLQAKSCPIRNPSMVVREVPNKAITGIVFYEGEKWNGASYFLPQGHLLDLDETWWNGQVSSLRGVGQGTLVTFYEDSSGVGSSLTLATDLSWPSLDFFGWGDRASAVLVWSVKPTVILTKVSEQDDARQQD